MSDRFKRGGIGVLEYTLIIILVLLIVYTLLTLLWPALENFYNTSLQQILQ